MDRLFGKGPKISPKSSQRRGSPGIPTNTAAGPLSFRAELDVEPKDEMGTKAPRIAFHDKKSEDLGLLSTPEPSTTGTVVGGDEYKSGPTKGNIGDAITSMEGGKLGKASGDRSHEDIVDATAAVSVNVTKGSSHVTKEVPDGFSPLKVVLGAISAVYTDDKDTVAVRNIEGLLSRVVALEALFGKRPSDVEEQRSRNELIRRFKCIEGQLRSASEKSGLKPPAGRDDEVSGLLEDLREVIDDHKTMQQTTTINRARKLMDPAEAAILNNVRCVYTAEYRHGGRKGCLKGTRRAILNEIEFWMGDFDKPPVYWLNGLAGTGKSTIAQTIAERAFADGRLGASFFCSRDFSDRRDLHLIFPTLAVQLARRYTKFRSIFIPLVQSDPGIVYESLYNQMKKLIVQPLDESTISTVIVIDALDECKDEEPASAILSVLGQFVLKIPKVKFFVTGRPEPRIREGFRLPLLAEATDVFVLHDVKPTLVNNDIRLFLEQSLLELARRRRVPDGWPTEDQLDLLCERAAGLFVYAKATVKFVDHRNNSPKKQLERLLQSPESSAREGKTELRADITLDSLYMSILHEAFGRDDPEDDPRVRSILGAVILPADPLPPSVIAMLLGLDPEDVFLPLSSVHSLLLLQEDVDHPVRPFHKSFPDFVVDPTRCTTPRFCISPPEHHSQLLIGCLDLMNRALEKNICKLPDAVANSDVSDLKERAERYISPALQYVCRSWHMHLADADTALARTLAVIPALHQFLEKNFLFWLEVLSILGAVKSAVDALQVATDWLEESPTLDLASDCSRFVTAFFETINTSAPHIYHSALVSTPKKSIVRRLYESQAHPFVRVVHGVPMSWDPNPAATTLLSTIKLAVWSQCNRFIAIARGRTVAVDILDSSTLQRLQTLESAQNTPTNRGALIFSPDSRVLTLFSDGERPYGPFLITWDLQTGGTVSIIRWQGREYTTGNPSVAYSVDGEMVGVFRRCVPSVILIFNVITGVQVHSYSLNDLLAARMFHNDGPDSNVIWTHGESLRFAIAGEKTVATWELGFTSRSTPTEIEIISVSDDVESAVFSRNDSTGGRARKVRYRFLPTSCRLASFRAEKVLVWDLRNSTSLLHDNSPDIKYHPRMSFSSDGRFFACSTAGSEIHLWKESLTGYTLHGMLTPGTEYSTPLLSPNGESIVAFGGVAIRLWHTRNFATTTSSIPTGAPQHTANFALDFSADGAFAVVVRVGGNVVTVLDLKSGVPRLTINASVEVYGLRVTGNTVVVIGGGKVIAWNLPAGGCVPNASVGIEASAQTMRLCGPQRGHVFAASISPNLQHVVFSNKDDRSGYQHLHLHGASVGLDAWLAAEDEGSTWFSPDGCSLWRVLASGRARSWKITVDELCDAPPVDPEHPPEGYPWGSSRGYRATNDGWVFGPDGKRLLMLPPHWRSYATQRVWNGRFLALLHGALPEPVILELDP